jgi:hypothetical protein
VIIDLPKVAVQHPRDVDAVLDHDRPVESVLLAQHLVAYGIDAALAGERLDRVAWNQPDQEECEQRHSEERGNDEGQPGQQETKHSHPIVRARVLDHNECLAACVA